MRFLKNATEQDVVNAFLQAELDNPRHHERYQKAIDNTGVKNADLSVMVDDEKYALLKTARGWPDEMLFKHFPRAVEWQWAEIDDADLERLRYINYSYWNELSKNSSSPLKARETIESNIEIFGQTNKQFYRIAKAVFEKTVFPPLVLCKLSDGDYMIIEGHTRVTGFTLAGRVPDGQKVIIGKGDFDKWAEQRKD